MDIRRMTDGLVFRRNGGPVHVILYHNCYLFRCFDFVCLDLALLAIFLGLLAAGWWFGSQHEGRIPVWIGVSVGTVCAAGFLILVITEVLIGWSAITATGQPADYVIVLGHVCAAPRSAIP